MLLTVTTTHEPATDLGYLLHKHPGRVQSFTETTGTAHVFYPEATDRRCTAALLLEVDPVALVRGRPGSEGGGFLLGQYVNDRPYAASSMLALALKHVFRTALTGQCAARPELAAAAIPLEIHIPALPCRGGPELLARLLEPLGWTVEATPVPLDPEVPEWGASRYLDARLRGTARLADALNQLYVLLPVLDDGKHYWVSTDEVDKLIRAGASWLAGHPERELITRRYLAHRRELTRSALARLAEVDDTDPDALDDAVPDEPDTELPDEAPETDTPANPPSDDTPAPTAARPAPEPEAQPERPVPLAEQRRAAVLAAVRESGATTVGDLGCGAGALVRDLLAVRSIQRVVAVDVSARALTIAARRLRTDRMTDRQRDRLSIFQSALTYRDDRLAGLDAAVLMEVIEHVDPPRLPALERTVFGHAAPATVIVTTPNVEYNVRYETLPAGGRRHPDHRFEWTRAQFRAWAGSVADAYGYTVRYRPVGPDDPEVGSPTQMAIFDRDEDAVGPPAADAPAVQEVPA